jgi:hypothetical protein
MEADRTDGKGKRREIGGNHRQRRPGKKGKKREKKKE